MFEPACEAKKNLGAFSKAPALAEKCQPSFFCLFSGCQLCPAAASRTPQPPPPLEVLPVPSFQPAPFSTWPAGPPRAFKKARATARWGLPQTAGAMRTGQNEDSRRASGPSGDDTGSEGPPSSAGHPSASPPRVRPARRTRSTGVSCRPGARPDATQTSEAGDGEAPHPCAGRSDLSFFLALALFSPCYSNILKNTLGCPQAVHRPPKKNAELTFCESNNSLPEVPLGFLANYAQTSFS